MLRISTHRPVFVLGVAHWIHGGDQSLMTLLGQEGYTLQRVEGAYDTDLLKDIPADRCSVDTDIAPVLENTSSAWTVLSFCFGIVMVVLSTVLSL